MEIFVGAILTTVLTLLGLYLRTYIGEKGKNLATKEDIGQITKAIEEVKKDFNIDIAKLNSALAFQEKHLSNVRAKEIDAVLRYYNACSKFEEALMDVPEYFAYPHIQPEYEIDRIAGYFAELEAKFYKCRRGLTGMYIYFRKGDDIAEAAESVYVAASNLQDFFLDQRTALFQATITRASYGASPDDPDLKAAFKDSFPIVKNYLSDLDPLRKEYKIYLGEFTRKLPDYFYQSTLENRKHVD